MLRCYGKEYWYSVINYTFWNERLDLKVTIKVKVIIIWFFSSINFQKRVDDWMWEHKQILYLGYHTVIISVLMSKLKAARFFGDLKSKVKVIKEVKVTQKMKIAGNLLKRVENWKSHFQNFHINLTFLVDLVILS